MLDQNVEDYLKKLVPSRGEILEEMEEYAKEHAVPIMDLVGMECLLQQLKLIRPKRILEIGSAIGYSAIRMAVSLPNATIVTIERDQERFEQAVENIKRMGLTDRISVLFGDALDLAKKLEEEPLFDVLFIDAAKGQYQRFFDLYGERVANGGIVFSDNVLFRGLVAREDIDNKRLRSLAKKLQKYNVWLMDHPDYETRILPVGDGLAISIKQE